MRQFGLIRWVVVALLLLSLCGGCFSPGRLEFFQKKVPSFPELTEKQKEVQKQAAQFIYHKSEQTLTNALKEGSSTNVISPATETVTVAESLTGSLGKPEEPWVKSGAALAARLDKMDSQFDKALSKFKDKIDDLEGKKVENTGLFSIGYVPYLFFLIVIIFLGYIGLKVIGTISAPVGMGTSIISGGVKGISHLLGKATSEIIGGGEKFKEYIDKEFEDPKVKAKVNDLFVRAHMEAQSPEIQKLVKEISA